MLIQLNDGIPFGHPVDENNFRMLFRNTSFPDKLTSEIVEPYGFGVFQYTEPPSPKKFSKIIEIIPERGEDGIFYQKWKSVGMTASEKEAITEEQKFRVREERNLRLQSSDWMVLSDVEFDPEELEKIKKYRKSLRNITKQKNFPWNVDWPILNLEN
jgi:hypothetical protein